MFELHDIFNNRLPEVLDGYTPRQSQVSYAEKIHDVIAQGSNGLIEAGTGIGKTLGYLVPVLISGKRAVISTGTRNLQDQLFLKDLPLLSSLFPSTRVSLLKGRGNYLCLYRMENHLRSGETSQQDLKEVTSIRQWSSRTGTGDLSEILDPEDNPRLLQQVTSTVDNCLGPRCPDYDRCPLYLARARAMESDLVVVNHHLLFADLAQKEDVLQSLLPQAEVVVVDEAHRIPEVARQFFGQQLSSGQITALVRDARIELALLGNDDPVTLGAVAELEGRLEKLRSRMMDNDEQDVSRWMTKGGKVVVEEVDHALQSLAGHLDRVAERSEGLQLMQKRSWRLLDQFAFLTEESGDDDYVHWISRSDRGFVFNLSPVTIADDMKSVTASACWLFTSATLSVEEDFAHVQGELGLETSVCQRFDSPFDYHNMVKGHVTTDLPVPGDDTHTLDLVNRVLPLIMSNEGRTFFLFTSYRALRVAAEALKRSGKPLLVQGSQSRSNLVNAFRETEGAVLLATQSFWEGVDVRGADLRLLIIDKLPFPNPADPLFQAQLRRFDESGRNSFAELTLPRTVLALKQGFGRLVREETDRGLFVLGDCRVKKRSYGSYVLKQLPEMQWFDSAEDAGRWLRTL